MKLVVFSHKLCWQSPKSSSRYVTDGGFPFQMGALSELFDATLLVVPCSSEMNQCGVGNLSGHNLSVAPLTALNGNGWRRKVNLPLWLVHNALVLIRSTQGADAVHAPIPGDIGTLGMLLAVLMRKRLFVRHCGNWFVQRTIAERFWKWFMERFAGGRNVMVATGAAAEPPSHRNSEVRWIFSTALTDKELEACAARRDQRPNGHARLIIVCRQERFKGTGTIIKSLPSIRKDFPDVVLDVVGDGQALAEFRALAAAEGVGDRVTFHGKVDHTTVIQLLRRADLFCYPTASEGFPKVVLEALACGLPVITTRVSVLPRLIENRCGLLLEEATPPAVAQAVREILADGERYRVMSSQAEKTARQYSLERWRDTIGDFLRSAWGGLRLDA